MEVIEGQNYARQFVSLSEKHFINCNFSQDISGTVLNITNSTFENCNLVNCLIDNSNTLIDCNNTQIDFGAIE